MTKDVFYISKNTFSIIICVFSKTRIILLYLYCIVNTLEKSLAMYS